MTIKLIELPAIALGAGLLIMMARDFWKSWKGEKPDPKDKF